MTNEEKYKSIVQSIVDNNPDGTCHDIIRGIYHALYERFHPVCAKVDRNDKDTWPILIFVDRKELTAKDVK